MRYQLRGAPWDLLEGDLGMVIAVKKYERLKTCGKGNQSNPQSWDLLLQEVYFSAVCVLDETLILWGNKSYDM